MTETAPDGAAAIRDHLQLRAGSEELELNDEVIIDVIVTRSDQGDDQRSQDDADTEDADDDAGWGDDNNDNEQGGDPEW